MEGDEADGVSPDVKISQAVRAGRREAATGCNVFIVEVAANGRRCVHYQVCPGKWLQQGTLKAEDRDELERSHEDCRRGAFSL